jgi:hypothetical protein
VGSAGFKPVWGVTRVILGGFDSHILPPIDCLGTFAECANVSFSFCDFLRIKVLQKGQGKLAACPEPVPEFAELEPFLKGFLLKDDI